MTDDVLNDPFIARIKDAQDELDEAVAAMNAATARWEQALADANKAGWTLKELGELLGVSPQRVHQIIRR